MTWLALFPLGLGAGFLAGLLGLGGGILWAPVFLEVFRAQGFPAFSAQTALGTSKAVVLLSALSAVRAQHGSGRIDWATVRRLAPALILGAMAGGAAAAWIPGRWLRRAFSGLLVAVAVLVARGRARVPERPGPVSPGLLLPCGFLVGAFASLLGIGGGVMAVPLLHRGIRKPLHQAMATSAGLMLCTASTGVLTYLVTGLVRHNPIPLTVGFIHLPAWGLGGSGALLGARLGVRAAQRLDADRLRWVFALVMLAVALRLALAG